MCLLASMLVLRTLGALDAVEPLPADVEVGPAEPRFIEARWPETVIRARPWVPHKRVATVAKGTRLVVRGQVESRDAEGCHGAPWYAVWPFGFVCSEQARPTDLPPDPAPALPVEDGRRLPFRYAIVRQEGTPMFASVEAVTLGEKERDLTKGMTLAVERTLEVDGVRYIQDVDGKVVPRDGVGYMGEGSSWQGVYLDFQGEGPGPLFAWVGDRKTAVHAAPSSSSPTVATLDLRERVPLLESSGEGKARWWRIGASRWIQGTRLNEVHATDPPPGALGQLPISREEEQWIDVDLGEQVLIAYRGRTPVYATLVSSGRGSPTPRGNYPVWAKVTTMHMANQDYEDKPYMVQNVPWVLLFQAHNALHGAYWHDRFGNRKSHGCVNLAPRDARWMFEWTGPSLPAGFTGYLPGALHDSVVVHVRDSSRPPGDTFTQERPIGPPDRDEELKKLEEAEERRALAAAREQAQAEESPPNPEHDDLSVPEEAPRLQPPSSPPLVPGAMVPGAPPGDGS